MDVGPKRDTVGRVVDVDDRVDAVPAYTVVYKPSPLATWDEMRMLYGPAISRYGVEQW